MQKTLLDEMIDESLEGASPEERFAAKLANASPAEFAKISRILCAEGDRAKLDETAVPREMSDEEQRIAKLTTSEFNAEFGSKLEPSLSGAMQHYRKSLGRE